MELSLMSDYKPSNPVPTNFKLSVFLSSVIAMPLAVMAIPVLFLSSAAQAKDVDTAYYTFGQYRYFGPKLDVDYVPDGIENNQTSGKRFYSSLTKHQYNFFKNAGRTYKEALGFGGWDKPYRLMGGFEYDFRQSKTSGSSYGYNDKSGTFFLLGDKALSNNHWRLGGGVVFNRYHTGFDNAQKVRQENYMGVLHAVYNNPEKDIRLRSRLMFGYGTADFDRLADISGTAELFTAGYHSWYYGFENTLAQTFSFGSFYLQPCLEFNARGIDRDEISEAGKAPNRFSMKSRSSFLADGLAGLYAGYKGEDWFGNKYNIKVGPDFTYIFSDPNDAFYLQEESGSDVYMKKRFDHRDYVTWKAYFNYYFDNGMGIYSDFRYYKKDKDSIAFALGLNYRF